MAANGKANGNGKSNGRSNGTGGKSHARAGRQPSPAPVRPGRADENAVAKGTLIIIGGHEDKEGDKLILRLLAKHVNGGKLVVATVASDIPDEVWADYEPLFHSLGVKDVVHLDVSSRGDAKSEEKLRILDGAAGVFFTGGDQLKITSQLGDTPIYERIRQIYIEGGTIAGTSAGASVVCETMMVSGAGSESHRIGNSLQMAPGFGLIPGVIIDQHFAQRGRIGRLIAAVAQNPRILGIGIDEDTAIICDQTSCFRVLGSGAVYVADGSDITYSNLTEEARDRVLSTFDVKLHVLSMGDEYDLATRRPGNNPAEVIEEQLVGRD
jgi:cyanophycinase